MDFLKAHRPHVLLVLVCILVGAASQVAIAPVNFFQDTTSVRILAFTGPFTPAIALGLQGSLYSIALSYAAFWPLFKIGRNTSMTQVSMWGALTVLFSGLVWALNMAMINGIGV